MTSTPTSGEPLSDLLEEKLGPQYDHLVALIARASELDRAEEVCFLDRDDPDWDRALSRADEHVFEELHADVETVGCQIDLARNLVAVAASGATFTRDESFEGLAYIPAFRAASALAVRHLLPQDLYDLLTIEWRTEIGPIHPDDPAINDDDAAVAS